MENTIQLIAWTFLLCGLSFSTLNAQQLKLVGGTMKVNNSSIVLQDMDFINNGVFSSSDGSVVMTGINTNVIGGDFTSIFDTLTINKSSGEVQLEQDVTVGTHLNLQSGNIDVQDTGISMADPSTVAGGNASSYVQTSGTGFFARPVSDIEVLYPVGNSSYNPVTLNNDGGTADFYGVNVRDKLLEESTSGDQLEEYAVNRTWEIGEETTGGSNLDVTLFWSNAEEIGITGSDYVMANYNAGEWMAVSSGAAGSDMGLMTLTSVNNSNLGDYAIFEDRSPLTDNYICNDNGALNVMGTITTTENYHAGTILTSDALIENTASILFTAWQSIELKMDFEVENGAYFHAFIASCTFSNINSVEQRNEQEQEEATLETTILHELQVAVYPNPFSSETNIKFFLPESGGVQFIISDLNGRIIKTKESSEVGAGWQQSNFEAGNLPSGTYLLVVRSNGQQVVKSLVVQE